MSIEIKVSANSIEELADKLLALGSKLNSGSVLSQAAAAVKTEDKPTRSRKAKEPEGNAAPSAEPTTEATPAEPAEATTDGTSATPATAEPLNFDTDVAPLVIGLVTAGKRGTVTDILSQFGAARASEVDEARWPELIELFKAAE